MSKNALYFHAQYRQMRTEPGVPVTLLETEGRGHYVGTFISMQPERANHLGYPECDELIYLNGQTKPNIIGTGTVVYFSSGWYYITGEYSAPHHGVTIKDEKTDGSTAPGGTSKTQFLSKKNSSFRSNTAEPVTCRKLNMPRWHFGIKPIRIRRFQFSPVISSLWQRVKEGFLCLLQRRPAFCSKDLTPEGSLFHTKSLPQWVNGQAQPAPAISPGQRSFRKIRSCGNPSGNSENDFCKSGRTLEDY